MTFSAPPGAYGAADPLFLLLMALAIEAYLGGRLARFRWLPHPRHVVVGIVAILNQRLNRIDRSVRVRLLRGTIVVLTLSAAAAAAAWLLTLFTRNYPFAWTLELLLLLALITQRGTWRRAAAVVDALKAGSLIRAQEMLRPLVAERLTAAELERLNTAATILATVAGLGQRFTDRLVAPIFWYVLLGLPGLFLQQAVHIMAVQLSASKDDFGLTAYHLDRALSFLPSAFSGILLVLAAVFVPSCKPFEALRRCLGSQSWPLAWPVAALGGALGLKPPPAQDAQDAQDESILEHNVADAGVADIARGLMIFAAACLINAGLIAVLALLRLAA